MEKYFLIYSLLFSSVLIGQNEIEVDGIIKTDSIFNHVNIVNLTQHTGISVNPFEKFKLRVQRNDTLIFSALNLKNETIIIDSEIIRARKIVVFLKEKLNQLDEVNIHQLSGKLEKDIANIEIFDKFKLNAPMSRKDPPTQNERRIYTATTGPGGTRLNLTTILTGRIPIDPVLNKINGRTKRLRNFQKMDENSNLLKELKFKFPISFFKEFLKIKESHINLFLINCIENNDFPRRIQSLDQAGLIDSLKKNAYYFNKLSNH